MSVINQMLRDLDARQASEQERTGLPPRLRTLPPSSARRAHSWRTLAMGMGLSALVASLITGIFISTPAQQPAPPAPSTPPAPAVVRDSTAPPAPAVTAPTGELSPPIGDLAEMKFSLLLRQPQQPAPTTAPPPAATKPAATKPPVADPPTKPAMPAATPQNAKSATTPAPPTTPAEVTVTEGQIDRRSKDGQAHEMAEGEYRKGMQAVKRGDNAAAVAPLQRALELDPALAKARQALLSVMVGGKQWAAAQQVAQQGLALDPGQSGWAMILARLQFEQGDTAAAAETLGRHAAHATHDADYQGLHAYLLQKMQRPAEAAQRFQAALNLRPQEGRWWFGLGLSLESAGRGAEAKEAYAKAREVGHLPPDMATVVEQKLK